MKTWEIWSSSYYALLQKAGKYEEEEKENSVVLKRVLVQKYINQKKGCRVSSRRRGKPVHPKSFQRLRKGANGVHQKEKGRRNRGLGTRRLGEHTQRRGR